MQVGYNLESSDRWTRYSARRGWLSAKVYFIYSANPTDEIAPVIARVRQAFTADGSGFKEPVPAELSDRDWRADPSDGLRPFRHVRDTWVPA